MKKLLRIFVVLVVLVIVLVAVGFFFINQIARSGIEEGATYALDVDTTLEKAKVGVLSGQFDLTGLNVANPQGFTTDHFLNLRDGSMAVTLGSLLEDTVETRSLTLTGVDVNLEKKQGKANYQVILDNLGRFESSSTTTTPTAASGGGKKFIIRDLVIRDVQIHIDLLPVGGSLTKLDVKVPEISLKDVGSGSGNGVVIAELADILVKAVLKAAVEKGSGLIPADMLGDLNGSLAKLEDLESMGIDFASQAMEKAQGQIDAATKQVDEAKKKVGEAIDKATDKVNEATKKVEEGAGKVLEGVGGLLKKNDDKKQ